MSGFEKDQQNDKARRLVPADEKAYDLDIREVPRATPSVGIFDAPYRCYRVNLEWDKHIGGAVQVLSEWKAWAGDEDERNLGTQAILEYLAQNWACGDEEMPTLLRQNPENDCQLQQSTDNGESWSTVFDFSLCDLNVQTDSASNYYDISRDSETIMNEFVENYTTVNNFAPALIYDESDEDFYRDQALCFAIQMFYEAILQLRLEQIQTANGFRPLAIVIGTMIGGIIAVFTFGTGIAFAAPIIGALISACLYAVPSWNADNSEARWREVQDDIVCCIYTNLKGTTVSEATFETALDGCDLEFPATSVATEIEQLLDDQEVFIMFLKTWEEAYRIGQIGILPACPCADSDEPWEYDSDFPVDPNGWFAEVRSGGNEEAVWAETTGWSQTSVLAVSPNQYWRSCTINIIFSRPVYISEIGMVFNLTKGSFATNSTSYRINALLENGVVSTQFVNHNDATNGTNKTLTITPETMVDEIHLLVRSSFQTTASYSGTAKIVSCHIEGTGQIPDALTQTLE